MALTWFLLLLLYASPQHSNALATSSSRLRSFNARIGIVGAGPAGLHMAYLLQQLGFTNLLVLEAEDRVGGRSVSVPDELEPDVIHELGTCYVSSDYADLRRMAAGISYELDEVTLPEAVMRFRHPGSQDASQISQALLPFVLDRVRRLDPALTPNSTNEAVAQRIGEASMRYLGLRSEFFPPGQPDYLEFPMQQPPAVDMARLNCTLRQFLAQNNLMPLEPYFLLGMTSMGYGSARDTSALYGLMWMTPAYLRDLQGPRESSSLAVLRGGFQNFWAAARVHLESNGGGVKFKFGAKVSRVVRKKNHIRLRWVDSSKHQSELELDWLVWTPNVQRAFDSFNDLTPEEVAAFAGLRSRRFRTRLVRFTGQEEPPVAAHPVAYYLNALEGIKPPSKELNRLLAVRNSAKVMRQQRLEADGQHRQSTLVAYYLSDYVDDEDTDDSFEPFEDMEGGEILDDATFDYMPRYSVRDMANGALWRVLRDIQGVKLTWFAGHSVVFDSVKSVMRYNKMLLLATFPEMERRLAEI